jgi:alpha-glucoside transport system substrate-binding protein
MRSKKYASILALLLALSLVAAACGNDEGGETTTTSGGGEATTTSGGGEATTTSGGGEAAQCADGDEVEVVWIRGTDHPEGMALLEVLGQFEQNTGATVNYQGLGDDLPTIVSTRVEGGDPPDVAIFAQPGLLTDFVARGAVQPVSADVEAAVDANFAPVWKDLASRDGTLYGVYFKASNKSLLWYNTATIDDLGITMPETWDELITVSQNLVDNGVAPLSVGGADGWYLSDWFENVYARTAGQEKYQQLVNHEIPWTDESVKQAFEKMAEVIGNNDFVAGGLGGALQTGFVAAITQAFSDPPGAAMMAGPSDLGAIAADEAGATPGESLTFVAFPSIDGSAATVLGGGDVAVAMTDNPCAQSLLTYLASPESVDVWIPLGGFSTPNKNANLDLYTDALARQAAEQLLNAEVFVFDLSDSVPSSFGATTGAGIWGDLQTWMENPSDIDGVLQQLENEAEAAQPMG